MFRIFDFICFFSFMFLFGELLVSICKDAFKICNDSLKETLKTSSNKSEFSEYEKLRKII